MPMSETPERVIAPVFGLTWGPAIAGLVAAGFVVEIATIVNGERLWTHPQSYSKAPSCWKDCQTSFLSVGRNWHDDHHRGPALPGVVLARLQAQLLM